MRQAAQLAAVVALDSLLMIPALFHSSPSSANTAVSATIQALQPSTIAQ
jgi:hypothetical protein